MNQIYRVIWNAVLGVYQAVAETGKAQGKGSAGKVPRSVRRAARMAGATLAVGMTGLVGTAALAQNLPSLPTGCAERGAGQRCIGDSGRIERQRSGVFGQPQRRAFYRHGAGQRWQLGGLDPGHHYCRLYGRKL